MANYANTKSIIAQNIYTNHEGKVTAEMVKTAANEIVNTLIAGGYLYAGIAHPGDAAVSPDANVFYIASEPGTYTNKGGLVVADGEVAVLKYNGSWSKEVTGAATAAQVTELGQYVDNPEFLRVAVDSLRHVLYGVKADGTFYFGAGVPPQVIAELEKKISIQPGFSLVETGVAEANKEIDNPEFLRVVVDANNQVIEGIRADGERVINLPLLNPTITKIEKDISSLVNENAIKSKVGSAKMCVELSLNGVDLFIAYNDGKGVEIVYWFKECMNNNLFTFYRVGYRAVTRSYPDTTGIINIDTDASIVTINRTSSDNIGPVRTTNGAVGGNHLYPDEDSSQHTVYKTAHCDSYEVFVGGARLENGGKYYTDDVVVKVENTLFDPAGSYDDNTLSLTTPLLTEIVYYRIIKNSIQVSVKHQYVQNPITTGVEWYSGMQSMFYEEEYFRTPKGEFIDWHAVERTSFTKEDYPNFDRFITKSVTKGTYQSAYLLPYKLGNHENIAASSMIFSSSNYDKQYHLQIENKTISELGGNYAWDGVYSFFHSPIADNAQYLAYMGVLNGVDVVFIDFSSSFSGNVYLPVECFGREIEILDKTDNIIMDASFADSQGVPVESSGAGSLIIKIK